MSWTPDANLEVFDVLGQFEVKSTPTVTNFKNKTKRKCSLIFCEKSLWQFSEASYKCCV